MSTPKPFFPAGHIVSQHVKSLKDLDLHTLNLDRIQLERGIFYTHLDVYHTYNVQLGLTSRSIRIAINGDIPPNTISFAMIINDASAIQQKHRVKKQHLAVLEYGGEIDAVFVEPISFLSVIINRDVLRNKYEQKFQLYYPIVNKFELRQCNTEMLEAVKEELIRILNAVQNNQSFYAVPENMIMIEEIIIDRIINLLHTSTQSNKESKWVETAHSMFELIKSRYEQDINIELLCKELRTSQRNAYLTFQKHYKMTPKQYLLATRLGKIKKILETEDPKTAKIEHIALNNGFYHMSHFAKIYKSFFGELPSETLWKHKS